MCLESCCSLRSRCNRRGEKRARKSERRNGGGGGAGEREHLSAVSPLPFHLSFFRFRLLRRLSYKETTEICLNSRSSPHNRSFSHQGNLSSRSFSHHKSSLPHGNLSRFKDGNLSKFKVLLTSHHRSSLPHGNLSKFKVLLTPQVPLNPRAASRGLLYHPFWGIFTPSCSY